MILTSSGTGAMEATITNILSSNDRVTVIRSGKFGERWGEICEAYGIQLDPIDLNGVGQLIPNRLKINSINIRKRKQFWLHCVKRRPEPYMILKH